MKAPGMITPGALFIWLYARWYLFRCFNVSLCIPSCDLCNHLHVVHDVWSFTGFLMSAFVGNESGEGKGFKLEGIVVFLLQRNSFVTT